MGSTQLLAEALKYASRGWRVLPLHTPDNCGCSCPAGVNCSSPGKHPRIRHGHQDATTDASTIRAWWDTWPNANVGVRTGSDSGLVVLDIDPRNGGNESLAELEAKQGSLPETVEDITGGGGRHLHFRHPGEPIKNSSGSLGMGLDVKADGGFVVAPPSLHESGRRYEWKLGHAPDEREVAVLPDWLLEMLIDKKKIASDREDPEGKIPEGQRNNALMSRAGVMRRGGFSQAAIEAALQAENNLCTPSLEPEEVSRIVTSVERYPCPPENWATDPLPLVSAEDLVTRTAGPMQWLVEELLPEGTLNLLLGVPGVAKTFWALALATKVASGGSFLGRRSVRRPVIFVNADNPDKLIADRLRLLGTPSGLKLWPLAAEHPTLESMAYSRLVVPGEQPLIIFDTFRRFFTGEENSSTAVAPAMAQLRALTSAGATVLLIHHSAKATKNGSPYRGSSEIPGAADTAWHLERSAGERFRLRLVKSRFEPDGRTLTVGLDIKPGSAEFVDLTGQIASQRKDEQRGRLEKLRRFMADFEQDKGSFPNQGDILAWAKVGGGVGGKDAVLGLLKAGEGQLWSSESSGQGKAKFYYPFELSELSEAFDK